METYTVYVVTHTMCYIIEHTIQEYKCMMQGHTPGSPGHYISSKHTHCIFLYTIVPSFSMILTCDGSYMKATCNHKTTELFIAALSPEGPLYPATISCVRADSWVLRRICVRDCESGFGTHLINHSSNH